MEAEKSPRIWFLFTHQSPNKRVFIYDSNLHYTDKNFCSSMVNKTAIIYNIFR